MHVDPLPGTGDKAGRSRKGFHYQHTLIDDCSRTQYAKLFPKLSQDNTCLFLEETLDKAPFEVSQIRMDNGSENQSKVRKFLETRKINYIYNRPSRPDMNGKVERVHRTDNQEFYLKDGSQDFRERKAKTTKILSYTTTIKDHTTD